ncbi:MAG: hypothetical protein HKO02_02530 [Hyphomonadaceae bacterium]|nr:hypothetical protein [Hyphomonadaceae bacterium]
MALQYLILMRHAKSSWKFDDLSDHQRPLNGRGRRAAKTMGQVLRAKKLFPREIWSSDSARTRETVARLTGKSDDANVHYLNEFYHAGGNNILYLCQGRGEPQRGPLMLVGHNPGWEELVYYFSGSAHRMPTGACAVFNRVNDDGDWLGSESWSLRDLLLPRDFES